MGKKQIITVLSLVWPLMFACAPNQQIQDQNALLNTELKHARIEIHEAEQKIKNLDARLIKLQEENALCVEKLDHQESKNAYLKNINLKLSQNVGQLNSDLKKKKSVIQLQDKVIRLLDDTKKTISSSLKNEISAQDIELVDMEDAFKVVFIDKILFDSGSVEVNEKGKKILLIVADSVRANQEQNLLVEGHTDNMPLGPNLKRKFPSNWELSTARAAAVVRFLQNEGSLRPERLSVRGYSFYRPVASNKSREGRRQNRRIEIILSSSK